MTISTEPHCFPLRSVNRLFSNSHHRAISGVHPRIAKTLAGYICRSARYTYDLIIENRAGKRKKTRAVATESDGSENRSPPDPIIQFRWSRGPARDNTIHTYQLSEPRDREDGFQIPNHLSRYVPSHPPHGPNQLKQQPRADTTVLDSSIGKPAESIKVHLLTSPDTTGISSSSNANTLSNNITWTTLGTSTTNADGRCLDLLSDPTRPTASPPSPKLQPGIYQIVFETKEYFERSGRKSFYPFVQVRSPSRALTAFPRCGFVVGPPPLFRLNLILVFSFKITFSIENPSEHYHIPLLISPFSYTTYRGS